MMRLLRALAGDDRGQDLVEYALLSALVGLVAVIAMNALGVTMGDVYSGWTAGINGLWESPAPPTP
jgi:Flp pilus assembly pilin Flp